MTVADYRMEMTSIFVVSSYVTSWELAYEFGVCDCTICNDIVVIS